MSARAILRLLLPWVLAAVGALAVERDRATEFIALVVYLIWLEVRREREP